MFHIGWSTRNRGYALAGQFLGHGRDLEPAVLGFVLFRAQPRNLVRNGVEAIRIARIKIGVVKHLLGLRDLQLDALDLRGQAIEITLILVGELPIRLRRVRSRAVPASSAKAASRAARMAAASAAARCATMWARLRFARALVSP